MEEKKLNNEQKADKKLSPEELNNFVIQLSKENEWYGKKLAEAEATIRTISRLDVLLRIVDINNNADKFHFNDDFISRCIAEIEEIVTLPEEGTVNEENNTEGN